MFLLQQDEPYHWWMLYKYGFSPWTKQKKEYTTNAFEKEEENEIKKNKVVHDETLSEQIIRTFG